MRGRGLLACLGLFTIVPTRASPTLADGDAGAALRWLPFVGLTLGAAAGLPLVAVGQWAPHATFVGAVAAVAVLAVLTRGLHLDGLADTADGLGSRAPAPRAREIMRQSDIGPFGVITLVLVVGADVAALVSTQHEVWTPCAALGLAAATGRLSALHASAAPPANPDGFGRLVAGAGTPVVSGLGAIATTVGGGFLGWWVGASWWWWAVAPLAALLAGWLLRRHTSRRFGGTTGDVFGALVETVTAVVLVLLALR